MRIFRFRPPAFAAEGFFFPAPAGFAPALAGCAAGLAAALLPEALLASPLSGKTLSQALKGQKSLPAHEAPAALKGLEIKERLGSSLDLDLTFKNELGQPRPLKSYFEGSRPVLMTMIYYGCPSLCSFHLSGLMSGLKGLPLKSPRDYQLIAVSMDSSEGPALAQKKKASYLKEFGLPEGAAHFLTGSEGAVQKLASQLGFAFRWDEETEQFAHSPAAYVLTPKGAISRYLYGVEFAPRTLKLSLVEAARGQIGSFMDRILLFCYRFSPGKKRYTLYAYNIMRAGGALAVFLLAMFLLPVWMRERKKRAGRPA